VIKTPTTGVKSPIANLAASHDLHTQERLEWRSLCEALSRLAQTQAGASRCLNPKPFSLAANVKNRWQEITELKGIYAAGYRPSIGDLPELGSSLSLAEKGSSLEGQALWDIQTVLLATDRVLQFIHGFYERSTLFAKAKSKLTSCKKIASQIEKSIDSNGTVLDQASDILRSIRSQKIALKKKIEQTAESLLIVPTIAEYLQDTFYTFRDDKYVLPIRLDGRGRIKGRVIDTSDSGQTLLIEPIELQELNAQLQFLTSEEKIEIALIFRMLSATIAQSSQAIAINYQTLIDIDVDTAEALFALEIDATSVEISALACIHLVQARHPLLQLRLGSKTVANDVSLSESQNTLMVSGPNAGGKTVVLKTVGLIHMMARHALLVPCDSSSKLYLFQDVSVLMGDAQSIESDLSTFSGQVSRLKPMLQKATKNSLVLLDELAHGTEARTGAALGRAILEYFADLGSTTIVTTHFEELKAIALSDPRFRNAAMEYSEKNFRPTYRIQMDVPGQSYGIEIAQQLGIPEKILSRAIHLRGHHVSALEDAVKGFQNRSVELEEMKSRLMSEHLLAEESRQRWDSERKLLEDGRKAIIKSTASKYEDEIQELRHQLDESSKQLSKAISEVRYGSITQTEALTARTTAKKAQEKLSNLINEAAQPEINPGSHAPTSHDDVFVGAPVRVISMHTDGIVTRKPLDKSDFFEVSVGVAKLRVRFSDLLLRIQKEESTRKAPDKAVAKVSNYSLPEFVPQTPVNSVDVRGMDQDSAVKHTLSFMDKCVMRGEPYIVVIHGHGTDSLKNSIRQMLQSSCPYQQSFRPGNSSEGGDGVTIIGFH
jgi:DNA mismatch repair protein MutS2